jgi:hypothetical protein
MGVEQKQVFDEFLNTHDGYIRTWKQAVEIGGTVQLEPFYAESYFVTFLGEPGAKPNIEDRASATESMRQSVSALRGAVHRLEGRTIRFRNESSVVVSNELVIERDSVVLARMFTIEDWCLFTHGWQIYREIVEVF